MQTQSRHEIDQNYRAFEELMPTLLPKHAGGFALLRERQLVGVYSKAIDAVAEAQQRFSDGVFSIQRITDRALDLGFLSYASGERDVI
jgi:hypothetical protein